MPYKDPDVGRRKAREAMARKRKANIAAGLTAQGKTRRRNWERTSEIEARMDLLASKSLAGDSGPRAASRNDQ